MFRVRRPSPTLVAVAGAWFVLLGLRFVVPALLPQVKAAFGIDNSAAGLAVTLIWACYAVMQFPAGILADRHGERPLLAGGVALTGASLVAFALAPSFPLFLLACIAMGLGSGLFGPARGMVLSRTFPDRAGAALGITLAAGSVGSATLPVVSTALLARGLEWATALAVYFPATLAAAVGLLWAVPPRDAAESAGAGEGTAADGPSDDDGGADDGAGDDTATAAELDADGGTDAADDPSLREVAAGLRAALSRRGVAFPVAATTLMLFTFQGLTAFLPTYLVEAKGLPQRTAAGLFAALFLAGAVWQVVLGSLADRRGERAVLVGIAALGAAAVLAVPAASSVPVLGVLVVLIGVRLAVGPVTNAHILAELPADVRGTAWGLARSTFFLLGATGSVVVGAFADAGLFAESFVFLAAVTLVGLLLYAGMPARRRERPENTAEANG